LSLRATVLIDSGAQPQPRSLMERSGLCEILGPENLQPDLRGGLARAAAIQPASG
jgi:hypothetical protein